jgi:hypothetical protein
VACAAAVETDVPSAGGWNCAQLYLAKVLRLDPKHARATGAGRYR